MGRRLFLFPKCNLIEHFCQIKARQSEFANIGKQEIIDNEIV